MKELTKAEDQVMQVLWDIGKGFVRDVIDQLPEPKPAYNTVSTIIRILEKKGFVGYEAFGKSHRYHPLVTRESYSDFRVKGMVNDYFGGSFKNLVSFFAERNELDLKDMDEVMQVLKSKQGSDGNNDVPDSGQ